MISAAPARLGFVALLAAGGLLEIDQLVAGFLVALPAFACSADSELVIAVEHLADQREGVYIAAHGAVAEDQQLGRVRVVGAGRQVDRLLGRVAVLGAAMGQEIVWPISPQMRGQRLDKRRRAGEIFAQGSDRSGARPVALRRRGRAGRRHAALPAARSFPLA